MKSLKNMTGAELEELYNSPIKERAALMNKGDDDRLVARMEKLLLDGRIEAEQGRKEQPRHALDRGRQSHSDRGDRPRDSDTAARAGLTGGCNLYGTPRDRSPTARHAQSFWRCCMSDKLKYLLMGVLIGAGIIFLLAMTGTTNTDQKRTAPTDQVGTYQLAAGNSFYVVLDTRTGKVVEMKGEITKPNASLADDFPSSIDVRVSGELGIFNGGGLADQVNGFHINTRQ